jgi:hypothetical protein
MRINAKTDRGYSAVKGAINGHAANFERFGDVHRSAFVVMHRTLLGHDFIGEGLPSFVALPLKIGGPFGTWKVCQGLASITILKGVSVARRTRVKPPLDNTCVILISPA